VAVLNTVHGVRVNVADDLAETLLASGGYTQVEDAPVEAETPKPTRTTKSDK
jgi:hypothetical protein